MTAQLIDGKAIALELRGRVGSAAAELTRRGGAPCLAVVLVGHKPASEVYVRNKTRGAEAVGIRSIERRLPANTAQSEIVGIVRELNADEAVDGILVQMPLPDHVDPALVIGEINPAKDVDGLTAENAGRLALARKGLVPCTPQGAVILAKSVRPSLAGLHAVVIGRSILVGKPLALLLLSENCTVTIAHSKTADLAAACRSADILCAAIGRPHAIKGDWIKAGATVIDVGINRMGDKLVGDVDFEAAKLRAGAITPVPGGVGPMTVACLLRNTLLAAARRRGLADPDV